MDAPSNEMYTGKAIRFLARLAGGTRPLVDIMNVPDNVVSYQVVQRASLTARGFIKEKQWQRLFDELHSPSSERAKELVEDIRSFVLVIRDLVDAGILKIASEMVALDALYETQEEAQVQEEAQIEETQEEAQEEVQVQSEEDDDDDLFKFISVPEIRTIHATQQHEENVAEQMQQQSESKSEKKSEPEKKSFLEMFINGGEEKKEPEIQHDKSITDPFESDLDRFPDVFDSGEHKF